MEGLIPMVYKTIKRSKTRRHYEYLGSATAQAQSYNIADFYINDDRYTSMNRRYAANGFNDIAEDYSKGQHHRRNKSFHVDYRGGFSPENTTPQAKKLVRFRSHRFFSCVTGA